MIAVSYKVLENGFECTIKELKLRKLIDIYFSDSDFYLANKDNIDFGIKSFRNS